MLVAAEHTAPAKNSEQDGSPLERLLQRISHNDEFPSISKYIAEINRKLSDNPDSSDASELANVILNDYGMTSKLLKLANSVVFGFAAGKVTTVTRAVVVLGYDYVRLAAISLSLFEHMKSRTHTSVLKEELICSLWSGMIAREIALKEANVDPEEAFIAAMLSRFGKLVMIRYLPNEYRKITQHMQEQGTSESRAVKAACGITYEALGKAVAKQWNFPSRICDGLEAFSPEDLQDGAKSPPKLLVLTNFVKELSHQIQYDALSANDQNIQQLLERYSKNIHLSKRQLKGLIKGSVEKVEHHVQAMDLSSHESNFLHHLSNTPLKLKSSSDTRLEAGKDLPASFKLTDGNAQKPESGGETVANPVDMIMDGVQEISQAMMADHDVNDIAMMSLEILFRSLGFHRALMFIRDGVSQKMMVRFGYGQQVQRLIRKVGFTVEDARDLFNLSVQVGKDLIVADAYDEKIVNLIPRWYRSHIDAPAFIFLPVTVQKMTIGALYADRKKSGQPITETEHRHLSMLRNQLVLAIRYRQTR